MGSDQFSDRYNSHWERKKVKDVAVVNEENISSSDIFDEIEYIEISNVNKGEISDIPIVDYDDAPSRAKRKVKQNDILISTVRPNLEHYAFIKSANLNTIASTGFAVVTAKDIEPRFLYYVLTSQNYTDYFSMIAEGHTSAYPAMNPDVIENVEIPVPSKKEQKRIAHILGTLDDKIKLNTRMNETLEAIARAIFKSWFVDFDPVKAKIAGEPYPLPDAIMALFPDELVESKLGLIPKGWEVVTVGDVYEFLYGKSLPKRKRILGQYPVYGSNGVIGTHNEKLVNGPGIVIGRKGNPGFVTWAANDFYPIDTTFYINTELPMIFAFYQMDFLSISRLSADSAVPGLNRNIAYLEEIVLPKYITMSTFEKFTSKMYKKINFNNVEIKTLTYIKYSLIPKLLSGEI